jgi:hypothetical protein
MGASVCESLVVFISSFLIADEIRHLLLNWLAGKKLRSVKIWQSALIADETLYMLKNSFTGDSLGNVKIYCDR